MNKKIPDDYVAMATTICPICGEEHKDTNTILMHKHFKSIPKDKTCIGYELCKAHKELFEQDYIALIEVVAPTYEQKILKIENAIRTGNCAYIRRSVFEKIFDTNIEKTQSMTFINEETFKLIKEMKIKSE